MRRTTAGIVGVVAALAMVLAGCSSGVQGQGQAASTPATSSSATTESSETTESSDETSSSEASETTEDSTESSTRESTAESSDDVPPSDLDPDTEAFFQAFCGGATAMAEFTSPDTSGLTMDQVQATIIEAYTNLSSSATDTAFLLEELTVPPIENGQQLYDNAIERFRVIGAVYGNGVETIKVTPATEQDLRAAIDLIEQEVRDTSPETVDVVDPAVQAAVRQLPECQGLF
jgi:predicted small secreted protein